MMLEVVIAIGDGETIIDANAKAKQLLESAKAIGTAAGHIVFGRQKFPL